MKAHPHRTLDKGQRASAIVEHQRVWERSPDPRRATGYAPEWKPRGTYGLLIAVLGVYVLQWLVASSLGGGWHNYLFTVSTAWYWHPWGLVTSTFAHSLGSLSHILFNGLILFFFGPIAERLLGTQRFVTLFIISGAISGLFQVTLEPGAALGASGALMMTFGLLVMIMPREKLLVYGIIPVPFWVAGIGYAALDILGAFNQADGIGNFAHLSGMALGLWLGWDIKRRARRRTVVQHWTALR